MVLHYRIRGAAALVPGMHSRISMTSSQGTRSKDHVELGSGAALLGASRETVVIDDSSLQAWSHLAAASAIAAENSVAGPLAGVHFGVKDVIDVAGMPTRCGSTASDSRP